MEQIEFVHETPEGAWYYCTGEKYACFRKGKLCGKMSVSDIPDPDLTWFKKCEAAGVEPNSIKGIALKPALVIYKLWEHKNAKLNS